MSKQYCRYKDSVEKQCERARAGGDFCEFHTPLDHGFRVSDEDFYLKLFELIELEDGYWVGFIFPSKVVKDSLVFSFEVNVAEAVFDELELSKVKFEKSLLASRVSVNGSLHLSRVQITENLMFEAGHVVGVADIGQLSVGEVIVSYLGLCFIQSLS